jgi:hypothetical protein
MLSRAHQIRQYQVSLINMMDHYTEVLHAAGITGHAFMGTDMDDLHDQAVARLQYIVKRNRIAPVKLKAQLRPRKEIE